jgi:hypothetical protein
MIAHPNRSTKKIIAASAAVLHTHEHDYSALLLSVRASFNAAVANGAVLFTTNADGLNDLYLDQLPTERQVHTCHCCRRFIGIYGNLVMVADSGELVPVMWNPEGVPDFYLSAFAAMYASVKKARIESVFLTKETIWGNPVTGDWSHLSVVPPAALVYRERALTTNQAMAAAKENFRTVATALTEFTKPMLDEAMRLFTADTLSRSEKFVAPVKWLRALHDRPKGRAGENLMWLAIATAPEGYCHPRASVIASLLDDIAAGKPFEVIKRNFDAKLAPLAYQRPQAAPSVGNIKAAEALVEKLGIAPSLERRFANVSDLREIMWSPADKAPDKAEGVFGHLKPKNGNVVPPVNLPTSTMTWEKFARTVLPNAEQLDLMVPSSGRFIALTTAVNADAPPILKWDRDDERNPVAWYVYPNGSLASQWGLAARSWAKVAAISPFPNHWGAHPMPFIGEGLVLVLEGAADSKDNSGNALFPECLKDELHGARATIEAYSRNAKLGGREVGQLASGYDVRKSNSPSSVDCTVRVLAGGAWTSYHIDRWD